MKETLALRSLRVPQSHLTPRTFALPAMLLTQTFPRTIALKLPLHFTLFPAPFHPPIIFETTNVRLHHQASPWTTWMFPPPWLERPPITCHASAQKLFRILLLVHRNNSGSQLVLLLLLSITHRTPAINTFLPIDLPSFKDLLTKLLLRTPCIVRSTKCGSPDSGLYNCRTGCSDTCAFYVLRYLLCSH